MEYSRQKFRAWLETLPADEPFCGDCRCPISEYMRREGFPIHNAIAITYDVNLVDAIDSRCPTPMNAPRERWARLTPRQVLAIMDELQ